MTSDTPFIVGQALTVALDLQDRFPVGSRIHMEGQNIETACRNILRVLPFELAKPGGPPEPQWPRLRLVKPE